MQSTQDLVQDDEIDLRELFLCLWAYKLFIIGACALGIFFGAWYALNADKNYTSEAIFKLDSGQGGGVSLNGNLGALASIAGLGGSGSGAKLPKDQIRGRIFIEKLDEQLHLRKDPFFNKYNPNSADPSWKATVKRLIGWQTPFPNHSEAIWQSVISTYNNVVTFDQSKDDTVTIMVKHEKAQRAAAIANTVMNLIISNSLDKKSIEKDNQLNYLSATLATTLSEVEVSQSNLKSFAMENTALPLENFTASSLKLDRLREKLIRASELYAAVAELLVLLQENKVNQEHYLLLRQKFPIVDQADFRRVLGQNEIISSWSWPEESSVVAVFNTLSERKNRLKSQINATQMETERSGRLLETYATLKRKAEISEATYTVLIEQVKAQSMVSGYRPDVSEVYEYAAPSLVPSEPKQKQILLLFAVLGLLMGCGIALVFSVSRRVYYSKKTLIAGARADLKASSRSLIPLRECSLSDLNVRLKIKTPLVLRDLVMEINKSGTNQVVVTSLRAKLTGNDVARALASCMQSKTSRVAVINFSRNDEKLSSQSETVSVGSFAVIEVDGQVSALMPDSDVSVSDLLSQRDFLDNLQLLSSNFDLIFLCADNGNALGLLRALEGQKMFHITLARTKHTKSDSLLKMRSLLPIQGLLHD